MLEHALYYEKLGMSVIPLYSIIDGKCTCGDPGCKKPGKHPSVKWKISSAKKASPEDITKWWKSKPESNIGIVTGAISKITVIDVDGVEGLRSLENIGINLTSLPSTPTTRTGGGGIHLIFNYCDLPGIKTCSGILPKVDIRSDGGLIVAPPSSHYSGNTYSWFPKKSLYEISPADFDFQVLLTKDSTTPELKKKSLRWYIDLLKGVGSGDRNSAATRLSGRYLAMGMRSDEVHLLISAWNSGNKPPLDESEILTIIKSISTRENANETLEDGDEVKNLLSDLLGLKLQNIRRVTGDEPRFLIQFEEGLCDMTTADMLSPKLFQQSIAEATKIITRKYSEKSTPTHDSIAQMMMNISLDVDAGIEATSVGEVTSLISDYLNSASTVIPNVKDEGIPRRGPFICDGYTWISLVDVVNRGGQKWGIKMSVRNLAQKMRGIGIEKKQFNISNRILRFMWGVDPEALGIRMDQDDEDE